MNSWFSTASISIKAWMEIIAVSSSVFFIIELEKYIRNKSKSHTRWNIEIIDRASAEF
ncbi:MAG: hypothetical protein QXJ68_07260 [Methanocellales archaeon]